MADFEAFMTKILQRPLPGNAMARVRTLAKEFAEGAVEEVWGTELRYLVNYETFPDGTQKLTLEAADELVKSYLERRWQNKPPALWLLRDNDYLTEVSENRFWYSYHIKRSAFELLQEVEPSKIFISYRRRESSAFALLVLARLKEHGLDAFLDMTIQPGDDWHAHLKAQIQKRDYVVLLLGKESLTSEVVQKEIKWGLESNAVILPIWHNGFTYQSGAFDVDPQIDDLLGNTHTIRVLEESALAYNNAIVELLNRFGITP